MMKFMRNKGINKEELTIRILGIYLQSRSYKINKKLLMLNMRIKLIRILM